MDAGSPSRSLPPRPQPWHTGLCDGGQGMCTPRPQPQRPGLRQELSEQNPESSCTQSRSSHTLHRAPFFPGKPPLPRSPGMFFSTCSLQRPHFLPPPLPGQ